METNKPGLKLERQSAFICVIRGMAFSVFSAISALKAVKSPHVFQPA
ncbi:MAG: hypothetical protein L0099_11425 [Acidobacteria bacterium]|nr:hypothetical protein [Acidobacteriota bacterium]